MKEPIVSLETAKLLKEVGFDEPCVNVYKENKLYQHKAKRWICGIDKKVWQVEAIKNYD